MADTRDLLADDATSMQQRLEEGIDPNLTVDGDVDGVTLLAVHCFLGHPAVVEQLLQHGADPDRGRGESGETPLHHVLAGGGGDQHQLQIVNALLAAQADVNRPCGEGIVSANFMRDVKVRGERPLHRALSHPA